MDSSNNMNHPPSSSSSSPSSSSSVLVSSSTLGFSKPSMRELSRRSNTSIATSSVTSVTCSDNNHHQQQQQRRWQPTRASSLSSIVWFTFLGFFFESSPQSSFLLFTILLPFSVCCFWSGLSFWGARWLGFGLAWRGLWFAETISVITNDGRIIVVRSGFSLPLSVEPNCHC